MKDSRIYNDILNYQPYDDKEANDKRVMLKYMEIFDNLLVRDNDLAHFTVSAWVVNPNHDKVLMIYHNIYDSWAWVGGHADGDNDFIHVARKEVEEETGVTNLELLDNNIFGLNVITVEHHIKRGKEVNSHLHFDIEYVFSAPDDVLLRIKEDENSGVKWIPFDEVNNYSSEDKMKPIYAKLIDKVKHL